MNPVLTVSINPGQIIGGIIALGIVQGVVAAVSFRVFKAQATTWHADNLKRFGNIEKALGLTNPDEVAFLRASEARTLVEDADKTHARQDAAIFHLRERLGVVESDVKHHEGRLDTLEARRRRA